MADELEVDANYEEFEQGDYDDGKWNLKVAFTLLQKLY